MNFFKKLNNYSVNVIVEGKESGVQFDRPNETFSYKNVSKLETDDANSFQEIDLGNKVIATESNDQEGCDFEAAIEATSKFVKKTKKKKNTNSLLSFYY